MVDIDTSHANEAHRLRLRVAAKGMLAVAFLGVLFVFLSAFLSGDGESGTTPAGRLFIGNIAPGETVVQMWEGRPVIVQRRTPEMIEAVREAFGAASAPALEDPDSLASQQPPSIDPTFRSIDPEWFVALGLGTDQGCPVGVLPPNPDEDFGGAPWTGGFVDECRGSRYDGAGRVYARQYADTNLVVPMHSVRGDTLVIGGGS